MHIPDGFLGPKTCAAGFAAMAPAWWLAWRAVGGKGPAGAAVPFVAAASAFVFVLMMFNVPIPGGTSGHAVGAALVGVALGVGPAVLAVSMALAVQALVFQDGGITCYGMNCVAMALTQPLAAAALWRMSRPRAGDIRGVSARRVWWAGFVAGYGSLVASAVVTAAVLGAQPWLERGADGSPLYFPIGWRVAVPAMGLAHLFIGVLEGAVTGAALVALARSPDILGAEAGPGFAGVRVAAGAVSEVNGAAIPSGRRGWRRIAAVVAVMAVCAPLGLWLPAAAGATDPWGEWNAKDTAKNAGLAAVPAGMARLTGVWNAPVPDYAPAGAAGTPWEAPGYVASALLGAAAVAGLAWAALRRSTGPTRL